ncbi:FkbM family methyltransferase [Flavobacterium sp. GCM10027622]|uniref:FkbM family methyltransferase n=1 Tax=unclassified Flavobacterium TaxID=196869 RepID=UPI00361529B4
MKKKIKKIVHLFLDPIVTRLGYVKSAEVQIKSAESDKNNLLETFFLNLKKMGFSPKHIVDVGANHGTWTRETLKYFPNAYYTLLEPQEWLKPSLQDLLDTNDKITFNAVGAGAKSGFFNFTIVDRDDSCSFRYTEEEAKANGFKQVEIPIVTLNELNEKSNLPIPDIVKIDAEGLDIDVLKGANSLFGKTEIFMVEVGVVNKVFDNSFLKMINFMDENGYRLFEITDLNRPFQPKVLWLVELAFVKKGGVVDSYTINI